MSLRARVNHRHMALFAAGAVAALGAAFWGLAAQLGVGSGGLTIFENGSAEATVPQISVAFPEASGSYGIDSYNAGCGGPSNAGACGTASGSGVTTVSVSIRESGGNYWNGTAFSSPGEIQLQATGLESWSFPFPVANFPSDGTYVVRAEVTGSLGTASASRSFYLDKTPPPAPTITEAPPAISTSGSASFSFTGSEPGVTFECALDSTLLYSPCSSPAEYASLADGSHTFRVRNVDAAGNQSTLATHSWVIDRQAPVVAVTFPVDGGFYNVSGLMNGCGAVSSIDVCGTSSDAASGVADVKVSLRRDTSPVRYWDGSGFNSNSEVFFVADGTTAWRWTFGGSVTDGPYTASAVATDGAGWTASASSTFTVDTTAPPAPSIDSGPAAGSTTTSTSATFSFSSTETGVTFECSVDSSADASFTTCTSPHTYTSLSEGAHTFYVRAVDAAGNRSTNTTRSWTVDSIAPLTTIQFPVAGNLYGIDTFNAGCSTVGGDVCGSASDAGTISSVQVSIRRDSSGSYWNGTGFSASTETFLSATGTTSWSYGFASSNFPADGSYTLNARATDSAGNVSALATSTLQIDVTAPAAPSITSAPSSPTNNENASFSFTSSESGVAFECSLDSTSNYSSCSSPTTYSNLTEGSHTFRVRTFDSAGNRSTVASHTWTVDTTGPVSTITFAENGKRYNNTRFNNGCGTSGGDFCGTATDSSSITQVRVSIQRVSDGTYWNGSSFSGTSETLLTPSGTTSWSYAFAASNFPAEGSYTFRARATDAAGNTGAVASSTFVIDRTSPTGVDIQTANGGGTAGRADQGDTVTFTYSEAMDPNSILAGWTGSATNVTVRMANGTGQGNDSLTVWNEANKSQLALGSVNLGRNDYVSGAITIGTTSAPSVMTMNGSTVTITFGTASDASKTTAGTGTGAMAWTPSASALDLAGNACSTTTVNESGTADREF